MCIVNVLMLKTLDSIGAFSLHVKLGNFCDSEIVFLCLVTVKAAS